MGALASMHHFDVGQALQGPGVIIPPDYARHSEQVNDPPNPQAATRDPEHELHGPFVHVGVVQTEEDPEQVGKSHRLAALHVLGKKGVLQLGRKRRQLYLRQVRKLLQKGQGQGRGVGVQGFMKQ